MNFTDLYNSIIGKRLILNPSGTRIRIFPATRLSVSLCRVWNESRQRNGWTHVDGGGFLTDEELIAQYGLTDESRIQRLESRTITVWEAI